jgi:hypothetical protein
MTDLRAQLDALADHHVEFVVIGGVALVIHGSARTSVVVAVHPLPW